MSPPAKCVCWVLICVAPFLFASCLGLSVPKTASLEPPSVTDSGAASSEPRLVDSKLVDTWELTHRVNDKGEEKQPWEGTRTLMEFTENGSVIFNRTDKDAPEALKKRMGRYTVAKNELVVTDDQGNTSRWPYEVNGDMMVITMPEKGQKFHWRRYR